MTMLASILIVGESCMLSYSRAKLFGRWRTDVAVPEEAPGKIAAHAYDLLIICQTVHDEIAESLARQMQSHADAKVLAINRSGDTGRFPSLQDTVNMTNPRWLADAVASILDSEAP
jgi:hypothetical protein